jgi:hypothetical protein
MPGKWSRSRRFASTRGLHPDLQFASYLLAMCSLMLMAMLVVGAAGYASVQGLLSSAARTAKAARLDQFSQYTTPRKTSSFIICK